MYACPCPCHMGIGTPRTHAVRTLFILVSNRDWHCEQFMSNTATYIHIQTQVLSTSYVCTYIHMKYVRTYVHTWALTQTHNAHTGSRYTDTLHPCLTQTHCGQFMRNTITWEGWGEVAYTQHTATHNNRTTHNRTIHNTLSASAMQSGV